MRVSLPWRERHLGIQQVELEAAARSILREGMMAEGHSLCQARVLLLSVTGLVTLGTWCQSGDFSWAMTLRGREKKEGCRWGKKDFTSLLGRGTPGCVPRRKACWALALGHRRQDSCRSSAV